MPIKRLKRDAQFPCIGKLRKGGEKSGNKPGEDLTYFRFDTKDDRAKAMFVAAYGLEPNTVNVYLPKSTTEENFQCWQEHWTAGGLRHRCDGETCVIWQRDDGTYSQEPKPCPGECKEVGRLMAIIPELQRFAFVTVETHSVHDIMRVTENLQAVESIRGDLQGVPFVLKRTAVEISTPSGKDGKRATREKWLLSIEVDPAWASLQLDTMRRDALSLDAHEVTADSHLLTTFDDVDAIDPDGGNLEIVEDLPELATDQQIVELDLLGHALFNGEWGSNLKKYLINKKVDSAANLTFDAAQYLIDDLARRCTEALQEAGIDIPDKIEEMADIVSHLEPPK